MISKSNICSTTDIIDPHLGLCVLNDLSIVDLNGTDVPLIYLNILAEKVRILLRTDGKPLKRKVGVIYNSRVEELRGVEMLF